MMTGIVDKMVLKDGREQFYIFIKGDDNKQYFMHKSSMESEDAWYEMSGLVGAGHKVKLEFNGVDTPKGGRAERVTIIRG